MTCNLRVDCMNQDGRLKSGDRILQIDDTDVRDMNTEGVASVLRQSGVHVRLIVARKITAVPKGHVNSGLSVVVLTEQMNEAFERLRPLSLGDYIHVSEVESQPEVPSQHVLREKVSRLWLFYESYERASSRWSHFINYCGFTSSCFTYGDSHYCGFTSSCFTYGDSHYCGFTSSCFTYGDSHYVLSSADNLYHVFSVSIK